MNWRFVEHDNDYPVLNEWARHRYGDFEKDELPELGFMISDGDKPILCGFLITTNAKFAYIEMVISNPDSTDSQRQDAVSLLTEVSQKMAKELGYRRLMITPYIFGFVNKLKNVGFNFFKRKCYFGIKEI